MYLLGKQGVVGLNPGFEFFFFAATCVFDPSEICVNEDDATYSASISCDEQIEVSGITFGLLICFYFHTFIKFSDIGRMLICILSSIQLL